MMGLKLQPCSPGFLDSRDAILAADDLLYNGKHKCVIWNAFARRGMGYSAKQGASSSTTDQTTAFDVPMSVTFNKQNTFKTVTSSVQTNFNVKATCQCKSPTNNYKIKAVIPAEFVYSSSTGGLKNADSVIFTNINFQKPFQTDSVSLSLTATSAGCALDSVINDNRDTKTIGGFINTNITGTNGWNTTTQYAYSPTTAWQAKDVDVQSEQTLTSNTFIPTGLSLLSFGICMILKEDSMEDWLNFQTTMEQVGRILVIIFCRMDTIQHLMHLHHLQINEHFRVQCLLFKIQLSI